MPIPENQTNGSWLDTWRKWVLKALKGTHHHFLSFLPSRGGLISWLLEMFFKGITIDDQHLEILRKLPSDAILIYTIKLKSYFDYLCYYSRYRKAKVPVPELSFDMRPWFCQPFSRIWRSILAQLDWLARRHQWMDPYASGYYRQELLNGRTAILPLVDKGGFYRRFVKAKTDPLRFLIELQQGCDRPIFLVPHLMFFSKNPSPDTPRLKDIFFGTENRPGLMRRLFTLLRNPGKVFAEVSQPLDLRAFIESTGRTETNLEYLALLLRRQLLMQHNRHRQSITGPVIKSHEEFKEELLSSERLREFMNQYAQSRNKSIYEVRKQADEYIDEIAARYSHFFVSAAYYPMQWLLKTMFDGIVMDKQGLQQIKTMARKGPIIFVPCHKSHMDYLILSPVLYENNMPAPHIAAGKNLSFWPLGAFFRAVGAFFIRRSFSGAVVYSKVFGEYVYKLLSEGFNIEIFIEGGRSRTGKLLMPKLGLITLLLNSFKEKACEDMIFAPVYIGYDQVLEETAYLKEVSGGEKEPENISQVLKARRFLKRRYGKIYINFANPTSLKDLLAESNSSLETMSTKEQNALCRNLGWRIIRAIDQNNVVTPHALVASAALNCSSLRFTAEELMQITDTYITFLLSQCARLADTLMTDPAHALEQAMENYIQRKFIELPSGEKNMPMEMAQYILSANKRLQLEYYKNNCIASFVPAAFTAMAILELDAFQFSSTDLHNRYRFLQSLFKYEFAYDLEKSAEVLVRKNIKSFIDDAIVIPHATLPDTYQITSAGFRKLKLFARFLLTYFESYWVVLAYFKQTPRGDAGAEERPKKIRALGKTMLKQHELVLSESLSQINYDNAINYFTSKGVRGSENIDKIEPFENTIRTCLQILKQ
ncbi:MAG: 1-acyl-sn-glycerol-3-phosphate acyltransferase [Desulfobacteraceae bacterium]|nr:1-acyl-sn-glycerol-3-phosphate acyltransferase [Desulfobacteraceae bacterium]